MTEWAVAGIVIMILGGIWGIVKAVATTIQPLIASITKLNITIKTITTDLSELTERNSKTHERIFNTLGNHEKALQEHELQIVKLQEHEKMV